MGVACSGMEVWVQRSGQAPIGPLYRGAVGMRAHAQDATRLFVAGWLWGGCSDPDELQRADAAQKVQEGEQAIARRSGLMPDLIEAARRA